MVGDLNHVTDKRCLADQDLHPAIHQVRDQFERTPKSVKVVCVESHFPKARQPVFLQQDVAVMLSELLAHDHA
jgi:hypothetical protein